MNISGYTSIGLALPAQVADIILTHTDLTTPEGVKYSFQLTLPVIVRIRYDHRVNSGEC